MQRRLLLALATTCAFITAPAQAQSAVEVAGVRFPATATVAGSPLQLNGAGLRTRVVVRVYAAGLYLAAKTNSPEAVLAAPGAKRLHIVMLRDIDGNELGKLFTRGMQDNSSREDFGKSIPGTLRMAELFSAKKRLAKDEHFSVEWLPGQGTQILLNGKAQGEPIKEPEFFNALLRIWLGPNPADAALKDALLGLPPRPVNPHPQTQ
ncbi:MAG: hypothetical protein RJA10_1030 [Pseudomonadota bacterium]|jgi:hypothetical protein